MPQSRFQRRHCRTSMLVLLGFLAGGTVRAELFVTSGGASAPNRILVYPDGATGNTPPLRVIEGSNTSFFVPDQLAVDRVHGEILVPSDLLNEIDVFPIGASGNVFPARSIAGPATGLSGTSAVAVDQAHDELVVLSVGDYTNGAIEFFPRNANGNVAPLRTIQGPHTGLTFASGLAIDPVAGEIFITSQGGASPKAVRVFARLASGDVSPVRTISGAATGLSNPYGIVLSAATNEIIVADRTGAIFTFARDANGNVAPLRTIMGPATGLLETIGVSLLGTSEIIVANQGNGDGTTPTDNTLLVFPRTASGNVVPTRTVGGPATLIAGPNGVVASEPQMVLGGRFAVEAEWKTAAGAVGSGQPVAITGDTGYFWFFDPSNVEAVVKVLDGCTLNSRFWVFAGGLTNVMTSLKVTDLVTGAVKVYENPQSTPFQPIQDTSAFATCTATDVAHAAPANGHEPDATRLPAAGPAADSSIFGAACSGLCLNNSRFQVAATWTTGGHSGAATGVALASDTGYLWFFGAANVEAVVKVLDACAVNGHYWVFAGGLTNVKVTLTITDTLHGTAKTYHNPQGAAFQPIQDTSAFATCP